MKKLFKKNFFSKNDLDFGNKSFLIGVFFLPSALPIGGLFLLVALILSFKNYKNINLRDSWNYPLFASIGIILFSTLNITFIDTPLILSQFTISNIWINLINWLPVFLYYWGFQNYLKTNNQKLIFAKYLVSGTFPVMLSFIFQKFLNLYGPYETLFGLIVWFQKPISNFSAHAGLFSNPNYAAIWLVLVLPFAILLLSLSKNYSFKKFILFIFCLLMTYMIFLTASRNGMIGICILIICIYGLKRFLLGMLSIFGLLLTNNLFVYFFNKDVSIYSLILPQSLISKISEINLLIVPRFEIWQPALIRILERPLWGWGPSTFSFLHIKKNSVFFVPKEFIEAQHSHNIALELAHNFGIPLSIILITTIFILLLKTFKYIFFSINQNNELLLKKAWFASTLIIFVSHFTDITLYDGKICIFISILFAGIKTINDQKEISKSESI